MMLAVEGVAIGYRDKLVAQDVSFTLAAGEVLCLLGPNGCGKSTLFKTLLGLIPAGSGRVVLDGEDIAAWPRWRLARQVAYVPQAHNALFPFSVLDIVIMGRTAHIGAFAAPSAADRAIAERSLEALGVAALANRIYTEISGGERQLVLIARALAQEPRALIMDEPTASLDFGNQIRVLQQVRALAAAGIAIVLSTHDPDHAFFCADRVALLHGGRLAAIGTPDEQITPQRLRQLYGVDVTIVRIADADRRVCVPSIGDLSHREIGAKGIGGPAA
jgi:iron complex transport system ATP-binding protein